MHLLGLAVALIATGCSFDYGQASVEGVDVDEVPQVAVYGATMVIQRDTRIELTADYVATYSRRQEQEFSGLSFREFDQDGTIRLEGEAEGGTLDLRTEDVELTGRIRLFSSPDDATIESSYFFWNAEDRVLTADDSEVTITRGDGSEVQGAGLRVDGRRNLVEFTDGVRGTYVDE